jgi:hypothetical protein
MPDNMDIGKSTGKFLPLNYRMPAGRPSITDPGTLYMFAQQFYWEFRHIAEGTVRLHFDRQQFSTSVAGIENKQLSETDRARLRNEAQEQISEGHLEVSQQDEWLRNREAGELFMMQENERRIAGDEADRQLRVPGEPGVLKALLQAKTPQRVRQICEDAFVSIPVEIRHGVFREVEVANWPISDGSMFPRYLSQYAEQFIAAKSDPRFPSSERKTTKLKQLWFLSRALAGAVLGVETRTAINLVASIRPEEIFESSRAARVKRRKRRRFT